MPIPQSREELIDQVESAFIKLSAEIEALSESDWETVCVEDWSIKQVLAIRSWWSEKVVEWIEAGRRGEIPVLPAAGYKWNETPRLNNSIAVGASKEDFRQVHQRFIQAYQEARSTINNLSDVELLEIGSFEWAGKWPISRWISIGTARQYKTARDYIRRVRRVRRKR